ncbi:MAG TPA: ATP synthase F0 subunit B [Candidatus Binataceae bacterium]|nr:ATP synthase F0 subunit B [Candidatus Binataceae bacterium]
MHIPPNWGTFFTLIASFLVFWFLFGRLFFRPYLNLLAERERRFKDLNDRTEKLIADARVADEEHEKRLSDVRREAIQRREAGRRQAESDAAKVIEAAKTDAHASMESARAKIEEELKSAEQELERMGRSLAGELAHRVLGRPLDQGGTPPARN